MTKKNKDQAVDHYQTISMTGFGKALLKTEEVQIEIEIKSLNSRFLDFNFKGPRIYNQFEPLIREKLSDYLSRGRVDIFIKRTPLSSAAAAVEFNRGLFNSYWQVYLDLGEEFGIDQPDYKQEVVKDILGRKEILDTVECVADPDAERQILEEALEIAAKALFQMRKKEGEKIGQVIISHFKQLQTIRNSIVELVQGSAEAIKAKLLERISKLAPEIVIDETRMSAEVALLADRVDVTEEIDRLKSHFSQFADALQNSPNGRKLEFLLQEFGREINTIGSKAQDGAVQGLVVKAKSEIEKLREQVLNLE